MSEYKRLTRQSEAFDGVTLRAFCESCGEDDCRAFCSDETEAPECNSCPVQEAFNRLAQYEDNGSPEEIAELAKAKAELLEALFQTTKALDQLHPMDESEPCYIFEVWKNATNILSREALKQIGGGQ